LSAIYQVKTYINKKAIKDRELRHAAVGNLVNLTT